MDKFKKGDIVTFIGNTNDFYSSYVVGESYEVILYDSSDSNQVKTRSKDGLENGWRKEYFVLSKFFIFDNQLEELLK